MSTRPINKIAQEPPKFSLCHPLSARPTRWAMRKLARKCGQMPLPSSQWMQGCLHFRASFLIAQRVGLAESG